jgi:hypothetical protein
VLLNGYKTLSFLNDMIGHTTCYMTNSAFTNNTTYEISIVRNFRGQPLNAFCYELADATPHFYVDYYLVGTNLLLQGSTDAGGHSLDITGPERFSTTLPTGSCAKALLWTPATPCPASRFASPRQGIIGVPLWTLLRSFRGQAQTISRWRGPMSPTNLAVPISKNLTTT